MPVKIAFTLNLVIEGQTLDEVDDGLIQAAGQRLTARINQKIGAHAVPPGQLPQGLTIKNNEAIAAVEQKLSETSPKPINEITSENKKPVGRPKKQKEEAHADANIGQTHVEKSADTQFSPGPTEIAGHHRSPESNEAPGSHDPFGTGATGSVQSQAHPASSPDKKPVEVVSKQMAVQALTKVNESKGMDAAIKVLNSFGVDRLSKLEPAKYAEFIKTCLEVAN